MFITNPLTRCLVNRLHSQGKIDDEHKNQLLQQDSAINGLLAALFVISAVVIVASRAV